MGISIYIPSAIEELTFEDDFTGSNGDAPNPSFWDESDAPGNLSIQNNKLNYTGTESSYTTTYVRTKTTILVGDFDAQIDFDITQWNTPAGGNQHEIMLLLQDSTLTKFLAAAIYQNSGFKKYNILDSSALNTNYETTDISGKIRITRAGSVITGYIWSGSQWEWNGDTNGQTFNSTDTDNMYVTIRLRQAENRAVNANVDNFFATLS